MCDPDSAGLSAELHDTTTWDFANFFVTYIWRVPNGLHIYYVVL